MAKRNLLVYIIGIAATSAFWWLFNMVNGLGISNVESGFSFHPEVILKIFNDWFIYASFNVFWFFCLVIVIINFQSIGQDRRLLHSWLYWLLIFIKF